MTALLILCGGFILTLAGCEWLRPIGKLQSALPRIGLIHLVGFATTAVILLAGGLMRVVPTFVFWSGGDAGVVWPQKSPRELDSPADGLHARRTGPSRPTS